ncbi:MAG TPA: DegT/DnrJ/EryC1/StrS family aminotransferase [Microthrixaceae bacterium]|jgi:dTDP-4-amino-4,6-dideoxygalactose transaminase|nr:DegT/DnrJ/EryC1/StrS family aminotransferase [Microthrixaceae bacterium]
MRVPAAAISFPDEDREWILSQIDESLRSGQLTLGQIGRTLEAEFAQAHQVEHAISVSSGTSAVEIPLRVLECKGKEVLVQANTFFATAAAAVSAGADIRFVDCDPATMAMDPAALQAAIGPNTVGVVVVHIGGYIPPAIRDIQRICAENGLWLFEDAAHAHGSSLDGQFAGTFGVAGSFSFYPTKVLAGGEGGMLITNDSHFVDEAKIYRDQGKASFLTNDHTRLGYNWRMSEPHAAIALSQLRRLDEFVDHRRHVAAMYDEMLADGPVTPLAIPDESRCNYYKYIAFLPDGVDRSMVKKRMREEFEVGLSGEVYEMPLHLQSVFEPWADGPLPGAEQLCARHICLPVSAVMTDEQVELVVRGLNEVVTP